ncbi:peptidase domain-containing ABC transporter [uncultured Alistipes sp.]|jgi:ABC transporter, ATP-binding protein|uniref:peptidase domain-containing ABC transporter n=1 Tax=uncultured Alistipes sp. TaxID=538949 RepID=UPI0025D74615|nr:peptidase domain-containing ABC transporter [uncultured Alistipes sp.]
MKFPHYTQLDAMDCGPSALRIVAAHYGKQYSLQNLREKCHITREGVSLLGISDAAEQIGFRTTGVKLTWEQLCNEANLPCIVHWNQRHFVVVYKIRKSRGQWWVYVSDPAAGLLKYSEEQFKRAWLQSREAPVFRESAEQRQPDDVPPAFSPAGTASQEKGIALLLEPTPAFYKEKGDEDKRLKFGYLLQYLRPYKNYLAQLGLAMFTASILSLILPFLTQSVVDKGIGTGNLSFVVMILIAQVVLVLGQTANNLIRNWLMLHMTTRISISLISDFLAKLMRLPIAFFDTKMVGDIMQRIGDYNRIQTFLTGSLLSIVMAVVSFVIYGIIMGGYDLTILGIFMLGSVLYAGWILLFMKRRRKLDYMRFQEASANQSNIVQLINGMQDIKLNNCEKQKRWEWERIQARLFNVSVKGLTLGQTQEVGGMFIDQTKNVMISFLAASAVIEGSMTLGMMVALQYIIGQLNAPLSQFIQFVQATQDAKISLERLNEIQERDDEEPTGEERIHDIPENSGIEFRHATFQYDGPHSAKALDDVSATIPANKVTAIVGASGSGKTTMLKIMLGFYPPVEGEVLLAGRKIGQYSANSWRHECGTVMQEGYIFSDTIANNIGISDEAPDMKRVRQAAGIANIDEFIDELPLGYNTKIGADGHGLSTGQKQRLLIARAAYKNAKYLFFDEATNSLDANNERTIMERLDLLFRNKTVVIVAHRLSTVKNADMIIVLDHGRIVEQGTHAELAAKRGYYYELVKNQLELGN